MGKINGEKFYRIIFLDSPVSAPYIRSFSLQDLTIGTQRESSSSFITIQAVSMARESQLVYTTSTCIGERGEGRGEGSGGEKEEEGRRKRRGGVEEGRGKRRGEGRGG